ncbi:uncharacterized protein [Apostichopus japonicus]|uniref:uncharacterized protein isoform X2 n=1 Tax=Stichopus japonicus TaxID=307972 RepID=UPI003AB5FE7F
MQCQTGRDSADMLTSAVKPQGERIGGQAVQNWLDSSSTASDTDTDRDTVIISDIERVCWNSVPDINDEQLRRLLAKLEAAGVLTTDDLEYIREDDILGIVTPIQARKLIKGFKKDESSSNADSSPSSSGQSRTASRWQPKEVTLSLSPVEGSKSAPSKVIDLDMMLNRIPRKTIHILERNERLPPRIRKEFVRLVVDNIIDCKGATYPRTSELRLYASQIVSKYKTLGDHLDGVVVGTGYESLLKQFVNRVDNLGRSVVQGSLKRKALAGCKSPKERLADQYGCVNWQPESLPEGESGESQRKIMNELKSLWESGTGKTKDVKNKMIHTYATQRKDINEKDCVLTDIIENWPFLFEEEYLLAHFKKLMGFDIMEKMSSNFEHRVPKLYRYFQQVAKPKIEATHKKIQDAVDKKEDNSPQVMGLLMLLSEHLGEDLGEHVKSTDKEKSADTCIEAMDLQGPVVLVAHGKVLTATLFSLAIGGKETTKVTNPLSGVCVWFAAYYVFNLQYPEKAPALLEFIQRIFLGINPDCGTKRQKMKGKKSAVNPVVLKLAGEMSNFENDWAL